MGLLKIYKIGKRLKAMKAYLFDFMQPEEQTYQQNNKVYRPILIDKCKSEINDLQEGCELE